MPLGVIQLQKIAILYRTSHKTIVNPPRSIFLTTSSSTSTSTLQHTHPLTQTVNMVSITTKINDAVAGSIVGRRFRLQGSGHIKTRENACFLTEIRAGLATFFAMAYIISVRVPL